MATKNPPFGEISINILFKWMGSQACHIVASPRGIGSRWVGIFKLWCDLSLVSTSGIPTLQENMDPNKETTSQPQNHWKISSVYLESNDFLGLWIFKHPKFCYIVTILEHLHLRDDIGPLQYEKSISAICKRITTQKKGKYKCTVIITYKYQ